MAEQLLFKQIDGFRWAAMAGENHYVVIRSGGLWYWYLTRTTDTAKVDSYESAVVACQKHYEENSSV